MIKKGTRVAWMVPIFLAVAILACGGSPPEPTATPLPRPTQRPLATSTTAPAEATATRAPAKATATQEAAQATDVPTDVPTKTGTVTAPFTLSSQPFAHKSGAFTITLPDAWKVEPGDHGVFTISPDQVSRIDITFTNVGAKFDAPKMVVYIKAEEDNWFGTFKDYQAEPNKTLKDGSVLVHKTLSLSDGTPQTVFSYYWEVGNVIYEQDFWVNTSSYDQYVDALVQVANTMKTDSAAGGIVDPYGVVYTFTDPNKLFEFKVPYGWTHATSTGTHSTVDTFTAPDKFSYVENIAYDDGTTVTKADAGAFALDLLKQYYKITDLKVTLDKPQKDGSELLVWNSASKSIDGESFFETRGTTFLLLTWVVDSQQVDFFRPVWTALTKSYKVPKP